MFKKAKVLFYIVNLFVLLISIQANSAQAGLRIEKNRIIWLGSETQQSVTLTNDSENIYLIQSGVFDTPTGKKESNLFTVIPPLYRLDANKQQTMRILLQAPLTSLPQDRESIFYFSAIAIPGVSPELADNPPAQLSIGTRLVIKLFYRPNHLTQSSDSAIANLQFYTLSKGMCAVNNSAYFITLSDVKIGNNTFSTLSGTMIPPFSQQALTIPKPISAQSTIHWQAINDYGGDTVPYSASVKENKVSLCQ